MRIFLSAISAVFIVSCGNGNARKQEIIREIPVTDAQRDDVGLRLREVLVDFYGQLLPKESPAINTFPKDAAQLHMSKIQRVSASQCDLSAISLRPVQKCLVLEVLAQTPKAPAVDAALISRLDQALARIDGSRTEIDIVAGDLASFDMPYLARSFFEGRKFVFTTSLQQGSVGRERVMNLDSLSVSLKVNAGRLIILKNVAGQFASSDTLEEIVTSYPILHTVVIDSQPYYQVDFSKPVNNHLYQASLMGPNEPSLDLTADVIVPTVAHNPKTWNESLQSVQYFDAKDPSLVLDNLLLMTGPFQGTAADQNLGKDTLRPTIRLVQGLLAETDQDRKFSAGQALSIDAASQTLLAASTRDLSAGQDVPYFTTAPYFAKDIYGQTDLVSMVKKFDRDHDIVFVLSRNTPAAAVPVIKSAVQSYKDMFQTLGFTSNISVFSADEFAEHVRVQALDLPEYPIAADPRVHMISWTDDDSLGAAWGTTVAHPFSGRVISGDILLSGSLWSRVGCATYFAKSWEKDLKKGTNLASLIVPYELQNIWATRCNVAMGVLGMTSLGAEGPTNGDPPSAVALAADASFGLDFEHAIHPIVDPKPRPQNLEWRLGGNVVRARADCQRSASIAKGMSTQLGTPAIDFTWVKNERDASLAMLRAVVLHELGHLFGLRHNFAGSLASAQLKQPSPIPLIEQSDSFMDYNDYAIDITTGAMRDYTSVEGAKDKASFGIYDVLALAGIYQGQATTFALEAKPSFCTDGNVRSIQGVVFGDCRPDDFGSNSLSYALQNLNQASLTLKAVGLPLNPNSAAYVQQSLMQSVSELAINLFFIQEKLADNMTTGANRDRLIQQAKAITQGPEQDAELQKWKNVTGLNAIGLNEALEPRLAAFENENEFLRRYDALIYRKMVNGSFFSALANLSAYRKLQPGDSRFVSLLRDFPAIEGFHWKTQFKDLYASEVILPKGKEVDFQYFVDGRVLPGSTAKYRGEPVKFLLDEPTLNHNKVAVVKRLKITDEAGQDKDILATYTGKYNIDDLEYLSSFATVVDPYADDTLQHIRQDRRILECLVGASTQDCSTTKRLIDLPYIAAQSLIRRLNRYENYLLNPEE